jgi:hypothetical protein
MGLQRLITEFFPFCPKPHSVSDEHEAPINGANELAPMEAGFRQKFITEFCPLPFPSGASPRAQLTLTGDVIPVFSKENNGRNVDKNTRLFHFTDDPTPVLTIARVRITRNDGAHIKVRLSDDILEKLERRGRIEVHHFAGIREEHPYNIEEGYLRIGTGRFYTGFYDSGETALVKSSGDKLFIITKVGHHPRAYLQFRNVEYKNTGSVPTVKTTRGFIVPLSFYEQTRRLFPSVIEVIGKAKRIRPRRMKEREKQYVSAPD